MIKALGEAAEDSSISRELWEAGIPVLKDKNIILSEAFTDLVGVLGDFRFVRRLDHYAVSGVDIPLTVVNEIFSHPECRGNVFLEDKKTNPNDVALPNEQDLTRLGETQDISGLTMEELIKKCNSGVFEIVRYIGEIYIDSQAALNRFVKIVEAHNLAPIIYL